MLPKLPFLILLSISLLSCKKSQNEGYNCSNGQCAASFDKPQYLTLSDCQTACGQNGSNNTNGYSCIGGNCESVSSNAQYSTLSSCQAGCSNGSSTIEAPTQVLPQNGANNVWSPITYSWTAVSGATSYDLEGYYYSGNNQQAGFAINYGLTTNSFTLTNQLSSSFNGKVIYWRVRAKNSNVTGPWSPTWSYTLNN
jgi:hypothetical protein